MIFTNDLPVLLTTLFLRVGAVLVIMVQSQTMMRNSPTSEYVVVLTWLRLTSNCLLLNWDLELLPHLNQIYRWLYQAWWMKYRHLTTPKYWGPHFESQRMLLLSKTWTLFSAHYANQPADKSSTTFLVNANSYRNDL